MKTFDKIYEEYYNKILTFVKFKTNNSIEAGELTTDIFLKIYQNLDKYDFNKGKLNTWIYTIANNRLIDYYRAIKNIEISMSSVNKDENGKEFDMTIDVLTPETILNNEELKNIIKNAFSKLKPNFREIAFLRYYKEYSYDEIVKELDIPEGTVKGTLNRIRDILSKDLKNVYDKIYY